MASRSRSAARAPPPASRTPVASRLNRSREWMSGVEARQERGDAALARRDDVKFSLRAPLARRAAPRPSPRGWARCMRRSRSGARRRRGRRPTRRPHRGWASSRRAGRRARAGWPAPRPPSRRRLLPEEDFYSPPRRAGRKLNRVNYLVNAMQPPNRPGRLRAPLPSSEDCFHLVCVSRKQVTRKRAAPRLQSTPCRGIHSYEVRQ